MVVPGFAQRKFMVVGVDDTRIWKEIYKNGGKVLTYCNNAVYPFYILHQTVIVVVGYYVVQTRDDAAFKYGFLLVACFLISASIYHLYIRPFKIMRFTFGAK
jgi:hypothetical protein